MERGSGGIGNDADTLYINKIKYHKLWEWEKIVQNGQTEPVGLARRRTLVRREVKFVHSIKQ